MTEVDDSKVDDLKNRLLAEGQPVSAKKPEANQSSADQTPIPEGLSDEAIERYIQAMDLEDIGSWTAASQAAYIRARLKARRNPHRNKRDDYSHWDLF